MILIGQKNRICAYDINETEEQDNLQLSRNHSTFCSAKKVKYWDDDWQFIFCACEITIPAKVASRIPNVQSTRRSWHHVTSMSLVKQSWTRYYLHQVGALCSRNECIEAKKKITKKLKKTELNVVKTLWSFQKFKCSHWGQNKTALFVFCFNKYLKFFINGGMEIASLRV